MMPIKMLRSPLAGTAGVLTALGLLAIPLRHLTSSAPAPLARTSAAQAPIHGLTSAVLRLKLLTPSRFVRVKNEEGRILLDLTNVPAGESEHHADIPLIDGKLDLLLEADLGPGAADTAVFLTIMPDAYEEQTRYVIGIGTLDEPLRYDWREHGVPH